MHVCMCGCVHVSVSVSVVYVYPVRELFQSALCDEFLWGLRKSMEKSPV